MESQCGFRKGRGTVDQSWVARQIIERATEHQTPVHLGFVDLTKAYDLVDRSALFAMLRHYRVPQQLIDIIKELRIHRDTVLCESHRWDIRGLQGEDWSKTRLCAVPSPVQLLHGQDLDGDPRDDWRGPAG